MGWERALCTVQCALTHPTPLHTHVEASKRRPVARTELAMRCLWSRFQLAATLSDLSMETRSVDRSNRFGSRWWWWHRDRGTQAAAFDSRQRLVVGFHISRQNGGGGGGPQHTWAFYFLPSIDPPTQTQSIRSVPPSQNRLNQHPTPSSQSRHTGSAPEAGAQQAAARPPSVSPNPLRSVGHRHHDGVNQRQHPRHHSSSGSSSHDGPHAAQQPPVRAAPPVAPPRRRGAAGPGRPRLPGRGQLG